jgi:predicted acetyltransferase
MSMTTRWAGRESTDAITDVRLRCYGNSPGDRANFLERTKNDRFEDGDVLIASQDGRDIGTATHMNLSMWVRGGQVSCQGVAWVGTVRSHRRRRIDGKGIASTIMNQILDHAREREQVVSALMPFRASFYEHFGYGVVERQNIWTVPLSILPQAETDGFREADPADFPAMAACRTRQAQAGQCDVDTGVVGIKYWTTGEIPGFTFVDQPTAGGPVTGFVTVAEAVEDGEAIAVVEEPAYDSPAALGRVLALLGSLKDQYSAARIKLPADLPLNWWLKERQVPHRRVDHPVAHCTAISRMQMRVLDHAKFLAAMKLPAGIGGRVVVSVQESEGTESRFQLEIADGHASAKPTKAEAQVTLKDHLWAAIATGALCPRTARALNLFSADDAPVALLGGFTDGPAPFSWEYF